MTGNPSRTREMATTTLGDDEAMKIITFSRLAAIVVAGLFLAGCASTTPKPEAHSGYFKDYSDLMATKDAKGNELFRYVSPKFTPDNYDAVMIAPVEYYPKPEPTEQVSQETLDKIRNYLDEALSKSVGGKVKVVNKPGPGVARLNVAITAAVPEKQSLKAYQYIPIAFVYEMGKRAVSGQEQEAKLVIEARATDSVSGATLLKALRSGKGEELEKIGGERKLTLEAIQPLVDKWAEGVATQVTMFVKPR